MKEQQDNHNEQHEKGPSGTAAGAGEHTIRFRNYDLIRRIDVGGMGEVYLARQHTAFDREVAIKIIRPDLVHDVNVRRRFRREAEVNAHIKHGHILSLVEFGEEDGRLFFVTPYIAGGTLAHRLRSGPLSLSEVYQLFTALVKAVAYIHRHGVVHRDLKPSNILLEQEGNAGEIYVYLIDFGIASIQGMAASPPLTTVGTEVGTLAYMAPERLSGVAAPSNDIYSLGVILYQMLTGQLPSAERRVSLPQPLEYVINTCMAPLSEGRFTSAEDVLSAFEYAYQYLNATPQKAPISPPSLSLTTGTLGRPNRVSTSRSIPTSGKLKQEAKPLQRPDNSFNTPPSRQQAAGGFDRSNDYEAPTVDIDISDIQTVQRRESGSASSPPIPGKPLRPTQKARRSPLLAWVTLSIVLLLLIIAGLFFYVFQSAAIASANVNFSPQVHAISQVFSIKGSVSQSQVDENTLTIPVKILSSSKTGSQTGPTTQTCVFGVLCQQTVTQQDIDKLSAQLKQNLDSQISTVLNHQISTFGAVPVSSIQFTTTSSTSDPPVGTSSKTVTVTMTEEGQVAYYFKRDAQQLARFLLNQQVQKLGPNYVLISSLTQIGEPVVVSVNNSQGVVSIKIAGAGVAQYQFPSSQLSTMRASIKGMKLKDATAFLQQQPGVDATTVAIHLSVGDTLPGDLQQIKIIPINPTNLPSVQLTPVPSGTPTG